MYALTDEKQPAPAMTKDERHVPASGDPSALLQYLRGAMRFAQLVTMLPILIMIAVSGLRNTPLPAVILVIALFAAFVALQLTDRFTKSRSTSTRVALALAASVVVAQIVTYSAANYIVRSSYRTLFEFPPEITYELILQKISAGSTLPLGGAAGMMQFGLWAAFSMLPEVVERERARKVELEKAVMEAKHLRARAEVLRLRSQLEPHFLLNTLNLISGLVTQKPERARDVLVTFGELLQDALEDHDDLHSVEQEVEWLKRYVDILEARHGDFLHVQWQVAKDATAALVPRLLLQPLIENAIQHGALCKNGGGSVRVSVSRNADSVEFAVFDNGPGIGQGRPKSIGLENVRGRIRVHFPTGDFELVRSESETIARVTLPYTEFNHQATTRTKESQR
jgi:sensor histidine kinase YesM